MNYFQLFDLPVSPSIDKSLINKKYRELQRKYHPDFYSQQGEFAQEEALQKSAEVNKAYQVFSDGEKTIAYYLQLHNKLEENEKYALPPAFLIEMMELNEEIDEAEDLKLSRNKVLDAISELEAGIQPNLKGAGGENEAHFEKLKSYYYKRKYLERILDRLGD